MVLEYLIFGIGSGLGGMFRYFLATDPVLGLAHAGLPFDTMVVNVIGSFIAGFTVSLSTRVITPGTYAFMIGFAGGVTTYSAFSLDTVQLLQHAHILGAILYALISVVVYVLSAAVGFVAADYLEAP
jgi:CrcB protein